MVKRVKMPDGSVETFPESTPDYVIAAKIRDNQIPKDRDFQMTSAHGNISMDRMMKVMEQDGSHPRVREMMTKALEAYNEEAKRKDIRPKNYGPPKRIIF